MNCGRATEWLEAYIMGDLAPELADQLEQHLARCEACRQRYEQLRRLIALLKRYFAAEQRSA
ncbi:MAG: zf-HC2 domain-containing protein [Fimbriimonadales bacterium]|nr:zf-HC2 domain-containing protein [Fimbriimonadales bacterium]MDW8052112.1 zf-HC2 domain-containing protein [Armatimonadota bacterium]